MKSIRTIAATLCAASLVAAATFSAEGCDEAAGGTAAGASAEGAAKPDLIPYCPDAGPVCTGGTAGHPICHCGATCPFSASCPPGMYNTSPEGYTGAFTTTSPVLPVGCTFAPPAYAACQTPGADGDNYIPSFTAPVITSVVLGKNTVYGIGAPATPVQGGAPSAAVFAWGDNTNYQLGNGTTQASTIPQVPVYDPSNPVVQVAAGDEDACALFQSGAVACWGNIVTAPSPVTWPTAELVAFPDGVTIRQITHGDHHACALAAGGAVYCWGNDESGQLGGAATDTLNDPYTGTPVAVDVAGTYHGAGQTPGQVVSIVASGNSTCVLAHGVATASQASLEEVYCWGDNTMGSLGDGNGNQPANSSQTVQASPATGGFSSAENFVSLTGSNLGSQGYFGSFCAKTGASGDWYCWGADDEGQIDILPVPVPNGAGVDQGIVAPTQVSDPNVLNATRLIIGSNHGCALAANGAYCFGDDDDGQLGALLGGAPSAPGTPLPATLLTVPPVDGFPSITAYTTLAVGENTTCGIYVVPGSSPPSYGGVVDYENIACWGLDTSALVSSSAPVALTWGNSE